ncbi:MAG: hypothetical protein IT341_04355, partial [Chloroflexi bacterium]|nr:hypothetical protein [Chloroflexota bacterium]
MTRDPVGRRGAGTTDALRRLDAGTLLLIILVSGLVLRIFIAGIFLPLSGLANDVGAFTAWGQRMAAVGPGAFYEPGYFADYPPGFLYVLWLLGIIGNALTPVVGQDATGGLVKIPGIVADIGVAWLLFVIARRWGGDLVDRTHFGVTPQQLGLAAATVYLFNPGVIIGSAVWGQIDSVGSLILLATIYALARGWTEGAALGAVVAMLVKFQFAFLIPVVVVVGLKRHLFGRSADPRHTRHPDRLRVLTSLAVGVVSVTLLILPFGMLIYSPLAGGDPRGLLGVLPEPDPLSLVGKLVEAANTYTGLSINAFNLWRNPWSGLGDTLHWGDDTTLAFTIGGVSLTWQHVGTIAFAAVAVLALVAVARRDDVRGLLLASLVLAIAFFALPTRVHERYLFPALVLAAPLLLSGRGWPVIYGALSLSFFANIYWVYTEDWSFAYPPVINPGVDGQPMPQDPLLESTLLTDPGIWLLGGLVTLILAVVVVRTLRAAFAQRPEAPPLPEPEPPPEFSAAPMPAVPALGARPPGWLATNPADAYLKEPMRRLDRRDLALVLVLVAFAFGFRVWRLDVPRAFHFDEVYHARSAAEFLSNWRFGFNRDVYEWTHPMLAKYLIAGGMVAAQPNGVIAVRDVPTPSAALAVAPRRESAGFERSIGFRVETGSQIVAFDVASGAEVARWTASGQVAALAYDRANVRLLVGFADSGTVAAYELTGLLSSPDGRAPPHGPPIASGLGSVIEIVLDDTGNDPLLLRGLEGAALVSDEGEVHTTTGRYGGIGYVHGA